MKPFRRRRIPRNTYVPQLGFTAEPPLVLKRKRLGLTDKEDRMIYLLIGRPSRLDQVYRLLDPIEKARLN